MIILLFMSVVIQANDKATPPPDVVILDGQVYEIQNPVFLKDTKSRRDFKKQPFYLDFMLKVTEDPSLVTSKSKDPLFDIDQCISRGLAENRSLQVSAINCYSKEIDPDYKGYGTWKKEDGSEVLSIPTTKSPFLTGYLSRINVPQKEKNDKRDEPVNCLKDPSHPDLDCVRFGCDQKNDVHHIQEYSRYWSGVDNWCGQTFCPTGQAFLINNVKELESLYLTKDKVLMAQVRGNALNLRKEDIRQILNHKSYDAKKLCFVCPQGSKINDYGNQCFDQYGCDAVIETYSKTHKRCLKKYERHNSSCKTNYEDLVLSISEARKDILASDFYISYAGPLNAPISSDGVAPEKQTALRNEFIVRSTQAIERYNQRAKTCKDGDEIVDDFQDEFIKMASQYQCEKNRKDNQCKSASCLLCRYQLLDLEYKWHRKELPNFRSACGSVIAGRIQHQIFHYKFKQIENKLRDCGSEPFTCPEFSLTEQEVVDYAIRAGFDCARKALVRPSSRGSR